MKKYIVDLTEEERASWQALIRRGKTAARKITRARILLHAARGATDAEIVTALGVGQIEPRLSKFAHRLRQAVALDMGSMPPSFN